MELGANANCLVGLYVPDRWDGISRLGDDDLLVGRHPVSPGVEHAT